MRSLWWQRNYDKNISDFLAEQTVSESLSFVNCRERDAVPPPNIKSKTKIYFAYEFSGTNLYEILKNSLLQSICYILCNALRRQTGKKKKSSSQKVLEITLRMWLLSSGAIFLDVAFYWSCAVPNSSRGFLRTYFCWCPGPRLLERAQWNSLQSGSFF